MDQDHDTRPDTEVYADRVLEADTVRNRNCFRISNYSRLYPARRSGTIADTPTVRVIVRD